MYLRENTLLQGGKYRIVRYISHGGFGCTYEAVNTTWKNRRVAIKELFVSDFCNRDPHTGSVTVFTRSKQPLFDKLRDKFLDEADKLNGLMHTGIVRVTDAFEENGTAYYVMDYIDGQSLRDLVKKEGALSEVDALGYIRQVAEALQYVHSKKMLHLDIKPANIMLDGNGKAILIDFGVSKQYDEESGENTSSLMGHSPGYAPVEQSNNSISKFLPATDIYALGATLYHLLSGAVPPPASELASGEELPSLPASVSEATRRAVLSAMTINKHDRPQSVAEFLALLDGKKDSGETHIDDGETDYNNPGKTDYEEPKKPTPKQKSKPQPRKNLTWLWVTLVGIAGILLTIVGTNSYQAHQTKIAREQFVADSIAARQQFVADSLAAVKKAEEERLAQAAREAEAARKAEQEMINSGKGRNGIYQVGDYYDRNGIRGVVFEVSDGGRHGKVLSMDRRAQTRWCTESQYDKNITTGASSEWNGKSNTDKILSRSDRDEYPAFMWCRNKGSNWYLPSKEELLTMCRNKDKINATLSKQGGTELVGFYWSSTEYGCSYAWRVSMYTGTGDTNYGNKNNDSKVVRAVAAF